MCACVYAVGGTVGWCLGICVHVWLTRLGVTLSWCSCVLVEWLLLCVLDVGHLLSWNNTTHISI